MVENAWAKNSKHLHRNSTLNEEEPHPLCFKCGRHMMASFQRLQCRKRRERKCRTEKPSKPQSIDEVSLHRLLAILTECNLDML